MSESNPETEPWAVVGDQPIRLPERTPRKRAVRKTVGFVLMGLGGIATACFAFLCFALYYGIRHAIRHPDNTDVPAITSFDVALTLASGMIGFTLIAAGYWLFRGSLPLRDKFSA